MLSRAPLKGSVSTDLANQPDSTAGRSLPVSGSPSAAGAQPTPNLIVLVLAEWLQAAEQFLFLLVELFLS